MLIIIRQLATNVNDVNVINIELLNINWDGVYNSNSPNQSLNVMKSILKDTIDRHAPFVTKRVKGKKSPWMSKEIKRHMNIRDQLYRKARKSKKQLDWVSYKRKRNFVKNEIQRTKKNFISKELRDTSNKPDKFWNTVKKLYPTKSKSSKLTTTFRTIDNKMLTEKQSIADGFCQFFSSAANRLKRTTFPLTEITWRAKPTKVSFIRQQFSFKTVSDEEVLKHLKKLNRKSAMSLYEIPPLFLKDTAYDISKNH